MGAYLNRSPIFIIYMLITYQSVFINHIFIHIITLCFYLFFSFTSSEFLETMSIIISPNFVR